MIRWPWRRSPKADRHPFGVPAEVQMKDGKPHKVTAEDGTMFEVARVDAITYATGTTLVFWSVEPAAGQATESNMWVLTQDTDNDLPADRWWLATWEARPAGVLD